MKHRFADQPGAFSMTPWWITDGRVPKIVRQPRRSDRSLVGHGETLRRGDQYVRRRLADQPGIFTKAPEQIANDRVPKIVCRPVVALMTDRLRASVAAKATLHGLLWFLRAVVVSRRSQSFQDQPGVFP